MKKIVTLLFLFTSFVFSAQDTMSIRKLVQDTSSVPKDTSWKINCFIGTTASMTQLDHWQGGGQNNVALNSVFTFEANYNDTKTIWLNKIDCQYGLVRVGSKLFGDVKGFRKNMDQIFASSKFVIPAKWHTKWFYTAVADVRTQFAPGYIYVNDSVSGNANSDLTSPIYIQLAIGLDFKPADYLTLTIAPLAGKITHVNRQYLADQGAYGVQAALTDSAGNITTPGKKTRFEFGGRITLKFKKDLSKNVTLDSYIDLFSNYNNNPQNIDVVSNNYLTIKVNKLFSVNVISQLIYDHDIIIKEDLQPDGSYKVNGPRLQALTTIGLGFGLKF